MSRILLGVSGGIAAYKALELVRLATGAGHSLRVIQTPTSTRFVGEASFAALTGAPVLQSEFERDPMRGVFPDQALPAHEPLSHLELVSNADVFVIAPASANTIAKLAAGLADNLLTSAALAAGCPLVIAAAMNNHMYEHPATQANLRLLADRGAVLVEPGVGRLASRGEQGIGRLAEPAAILEACREAIAATAPGGREPDSLRGLRVLVTAGGTREPIDSVRYIGNSSSGRMGFALAEVAAARGAEVTVLAANVALATPSRVRRIDVGSAAELGAAARAEFAAADVLLMAAAVADFAPAAAADGKIKKAGRDGLSLELEATPDVLKGLAAARRPGQTIVGFAAEHGPEAVAAAVSKLDGKGLDALVVNDISRSDIGFEVPENEVTILLAARNGGQPRSRHVPRAAKTEVAGEILAVVAALRDGREGEVSTDKMG